MASLYLYVKAFHIIGFVAWFAGLFYWLRIFVYLAEALGKAQPARDILFEQFTRMERRVYSIITVPGMVFTWACGITMLALNPALLSEGWLQVKLVLLVVLTGFQGFAKSYVRRLEADPTRANSERLRLMNEVPTVFLLIIVMLAVQRNTLDAISMVLLVIVFMIGLALGVRYYRGYRARHPNH